MATMWAGPFDDQNNMETTLASSTRYEAGGGARRPAVPTASILESNPRLNNKQFVGSQGYSCGTAGHDDNASETSFYSCSNVSSSITSPDSEEVPTTRDQVRACHEDFTSLQCSLDCDLDTTQEDPETLGEPSSLSESIDPLYVSLVSAYYALKKLDVAHITSVILVVGIQSSFSHQPHWLLILLDNDKGCRRRKWLAICSVNWVDTTWKTLSMVLGLFSPGNFALPPLSTNHLRRIFNPWHNSTATPETIAQPFWSCPLANKRPQEQPEGFATTNGRKRLKGGPKVNAGSPSADDAESIQTSSVPEPAPRGKKTPPKKAKPGGKRYACHYYKRWPIKHNVCLSHGQEAPRYVKTHLLRSHRQPIHCPTCFKDFKKRIEFNDHVVERACERSEGTTCPFMEKISDDQENLLEHLPPGDGDDKWYAIWDVLFPGVQRPDSPYIDPNDHEGNIVTAARGARGPQFQQGLERLRLNGTLNDAQIEAVQALHDDAYSATPQLPGSQHAVAHQHLPAHAVQNNVNSGSYFQPPATQQQHANDRSQRPAPVSTAMPMHDFSRLGYPLAMAQTYIPSPSQHPHPASHQRARDNGPINMMVPGLNYPPGMSSGQHLTPGQANRGPNMQPQYSRQQPSLGYLAVGNTRNTQVEYNAAAVMRQQEAQRRILQAQQPIFSNGPYNGRVHDYQNTAISSQRPQGNTFGTMMDCQSLRFNQTTSHQNGLSVPPNTRRPSAADSSFIHVHNRRRSDLTIANDATALIETQSIQTASTDPGSGATDEGHDENQPSQNDTSDLSDLGSDWFNLSANGSTS
ncbi:hypothetical protein CGLO_03692 [Colletotrichum gloeosporioides Cg-14]|uniref:Uncharacterized protein n=1 Tax=Colletotrichum gloeosporioides (strain Cg-14) TaxID=1237896 RepID=T0KVY2_COLGC|nr:hypothetical protein CGLO_03692 [Colletotrichum gloeosporioides Cg-14]